MTAELSAFQRPQNLIDWAKKALADGEVLNRAFITKESFPTLVEYDPETGKKSIVVRQIKDPPPEIERFLTECLNNLRNSFDQSLFAVCQVIGKPIEDAHYPWVNNPDPDLGRRFVHKKTGVHLIHPELWDIIRSQEPYQTGKCYPGGDDLIRQIATLANRKHTIGLRYEARVNRSELNIEFETREGYINKLPSVWDPVKREIKLLAAGGDVAKLHITGRLSFCPLLDAPPPLCQCNAFEALGLFADKAQCVLDGFKARAVELMAN